MHPKSEDIWAAKEKLEKVAEDFNRKAKTKQLS